MDSVNAKSDLLLDGWYTVAQLTQIVETGEHGAISTCDESKKTRDERRALARALRSFLLRTVDLAEAFLVWSHPRLVAGPHRVHVEDDVVTDVELAQGA